MTGGRRVKDERELHSAYQLRPGLRDHQDVSRIRVDRAERRLVGGQILGRVHPIPGGAELISGEQAHDGGDIAGLRPAQNHRGAAQFNGRQIVHHPSLPEEPSDRSG